jgi:branched-chain amino acid transport system substrate-binding protein
MRFDTMNRASRGLGLAIAMTLFAALSQGATSCSVIIDGSADSCQEDADCVNLPGRTRCDTEQGTCVSADACTMNADCPADAYCAPASPRQCLKLVGDRCTVVTTEEGSPDDFRVEGAFIIGLTAPLTGGDESTGQSILNGATLAVEELNRVEALEAPLVLVACDDEGDRPLAEENGRTLAAMGIQAIIGPAFSGQTQDTASGTNGAPGTVANDVLLISSSATSPIVTSIQDRSPRCVAACGGDADCELACPGLVWRTSPSDVIQGKAMADYFRDRLETAVKERGGMEATPRPTIKVAVLNKPDSYGQELEKAVFASLEFNGNPATEEVAAGNYLSVEYGDPLAAGDLDSVIAFQPDVVLILGTGEIADILAELEAALASPPENRPYYFLPDGGLADSTSMVMNGNEERLRGTVPGTNSPLFLTFAAEYLQRFPAGDFVGGPNVFGAAGAYDTVYMLTLSRVAHGGPALSEELARGFRRLVAGDTAVEVGTLEFGAGANELRDDRDIDLAGASGPLDFDENDEAASDIVVWCLPGAGGDGLASGTNWTPEDGVTGAPEPAEGMFSCPFD